MPITVELQDMFAYSLLPLVGMLTLVVAIGILWFVFSRKKKCRKEPKQEQVMPKATPLAGPYQIKEKYWAIINDLEMKCRSGEMPNRKAYQELSGIIRQFVYEMTGIKVHNHTLDEIKTMNMPNLYTVIEECYAPEFSPDKNGDIYNTMNKARMVIKEWN